MKFHQLLGLTERLSKSPLDSDVHYQFHFSVEPNLIPNKTFAKQTRTNSSAGTRGEAAGEGIYTTRNPQYWFSQMAYEEVGELPRFVYLVYVKEPSEGSIDAAHQNLSPPNEVLVLKLLMEIPDNDSPLDVGKLIWLTDKYLGTKKQVTEYKLDELAGMKNSKLVSEFSKILPGELDKFAKNLIDNGFEVLGSGSYGLVFEHPDLDYVIKIFANDPAYLKFLDYIKSNPDNPHLPKLKGKILTYNSTHHLVRLEKLDSLFSGDHVPYIVSSIIDSMRMSGKPEQYFDNMVKTVDDNISRLEIKQKTNHAGTYQELFAQKRYKKALDFMNNQHDFINTCDDLFYRKGGWYFDLASRNVMRRGTTMVVTDPWAD